MDNCEHEKGCICAWCEVERQNADNAPAPRSVDQQQSCSAWIDPQQRQPEYTGKYLVWTSEGPEILRVEEGWIEYADVNIADWDEITAWAEVQKPNDKDLARRALDSE